MSTLISRLYNWVTDKGLSVKITASKMDAENDQLITALNRKVLCSASAPDSPIAGQTWVDTSSKYLKVYLNNEWVVHGPVHIGASAASTPFEGMLWYDTGNNLLKSYNGSAWVTMGTGDMSHPDSTAAGDVLYYSAADTLARLAKGTAGQKLKMNSGATAPEWAGTELGAWSDKSGGYGAQQAATDGFVVAYAHKASDAAGLTGYTDGNADPTTIRVKAYAEDVDGTAYVNICMPVRKGDYWKVTLDNTSTMDAIYFIPLGAA